VLLVVIGVLGAAGPSDVAGAAKTTRVAPVASAAASRRAADMSFLDDGSIRVGVDLQVGGVIAYVSAAGQSENLVNTHDLGRYVQQSYYMAPVDFGHPAPPWQGFPYNPIGAGDTYGNAASVVTATNDGTTIYVKTSPLLWPLDDVRCECTFEQWITLDGNAVNVKNRLANSRSDTSDVGTFDQELPAVYTIARLSHLITYSGSAPRTGRPTDTIQAPGCPGEGGNFWTRFNATEGWEAFVDAKGRGLGVFNPNVDEYYAGYCPPDASNPGTETGDNATGYMAPLDRAALAWNSVYTYDYTLIVGSVPEIRRYAVAHETHPRVLSLRRSHRRVWGVLTTLDGFSACSAAQLVTLQRLHAGHWRDVTHTETDTSGKYQFAPPQGAVIVRVLAGASSLHANACVRAVSRRLSVTR
jgi:hypothetical protein